MIYNGMGRETRKRCLVIVLLIYGAVLSSDEYSNQTNETLVSL